MHILLVLIPTLAHTFSGGSVVKKILLVLQFWYFALSRKTFLRGREMSFSLQYLNTPFSVHIESIVDLAALKEVFIMGEYNWGPADVKTIIDLGAHFGDTALFYHLKYPNAHIYAVEPAPDTFKRLVKNVNAIKNITPINAGIAEKDGIADLHIVPSSLGNSLRARAESQKAVSVPVYTLRTLILKYGIGQADIIKFDIEGAEDTLFVSGKPSEFSKTYIGEIHEDLLVTDPQSLLKEFDDFRVQRENLSNKQRYILRATLNELN